MPAVQQLCLRCQRRHVWPGERFDSHGFIGIFSLFCRTSCGDLAHPAPIGPARAGERTGMFYLLLSVQHRDAGRRRVPGRIRRADPRNRLRLGASDFRDRSPSSADFPPGRARGGGPGIAPGGRTALRRMPGPRPLRPVERKEGERRPPPQRAAPRRAGADVPIPPPTSLDEPPYEPHGETRPNPGVPAEGVRGEPEGRPDPRAPARRPGPAWLRRAISEIEPVPGEPPPEPVEIHHPDQRHARRTAAASPWASDVPFGRPGPPGPERPPVQEGWLRPRAGPPPSIGPEDYAPEPDLRRPRMPPAAQLEPAHEREPEPAPDVRMRAGCRRRSIRAAPGYEREANRRPICGCAHARRPLTSSSRPMSANREPLPDFCDSCADAADRSIRAAAGLRA